MANGGDWSDKFSLDVAGSSGIVTCKYEGKIYQVNTLLFDSVNFFTHTST